MRSLKPRTQFWILVGIFAILVIFGLLIKFDQKSWIAYFRGVSLPLAGTVFVAAYVGITFFVWLAKDVFRIVGAVVFGPYWSTLFIWIGELVNAAIFFHLSRKLGRAYVVELFHLKESALNGAKRHGGVWHIFLLRTLPILPFRIIDLAYGLTSVSFRKYIVVSALATPVRIFWIQFILAALGEAIFDFNLITLVQRVMAYVKNNIIYWYLSVLYLFCSLIIVLFLRKKIR